jgi:hypothetical protein
VIATGYILPIQPIQSQMYANRLNMESNDFAYIDRVNKVKLNPNSSGQKNQSFQQERERYDEEGIPVVQPPPSYQGFVYPNPVNLSPIIAQVVGKGLSINSYV